MQTNHTTVQKALKRQKGLGKLNRLIANAKQQLRMGGHEMRRFARDYDNGTATSTCKKTGLVVTVNIYGKTQDERIQKQAKDATA